MEGPSVKVVAERLREILEGEDIHKAWGNSRRVRFEEIIGKRIQRIISHGKNLIIDIAGYGLIKIHFLMYGSYSIDEITRNENRIRLALEGKRKVFFYNCSVNTLREYRMKIEDILDENWKADKVLEIIKKDKRAICDVLLDQDILPGVGNIIKVESLFSAKIHPESTTNQIPEEMLLGLLKEVREFSLLFYKVRKENGRLRNYMKVYGFKTCKICESKIARKRTGLAKRISYFCPKCQIRY